MTHSAILEFENGQSAVVVISFESSIERTLLEVTARDGSLQLPNPNTFDGAITVFEGVSPPQPVDESGVVFGRGLGVLDVARSIRAEVPERASGELALQVLDIMASIAEAAEIDAAVDLASTTMRPELLPINWDPRAATL